MADKNVIALSFKANNGRCERIMDGETKVQRGPAGKTVMLWCRSSSGNFGKNLS
jgi:hypothetical protein